MKTAHNIKTEIRQRLHLAQRKVANYLNSKAAALSKPQVKICWFLFCVAFAAASVLAMIDSFRHPSVTKPAALHTRKAFREKETVQDVALFRIHRFRLYMDSMARVDPMTYNSILHARPHLMDSILETEQLNNISNH